MQTNRKLATTTLAAAAVTLLGAMGAQANTNGQYGFTGRSNSCLACHGSNQYPGLQVTIAGLDSKPEVNCLQQNADGTDTEVVKYRSLGFGETVDMTITIPALGDTRPECPTNDCCDPMNPPGADAICNNPDGYFVDEVQKAAGECTNFLDVCDTVPPADPMNMIPQGDGTDDPVAGINLEVLGGGAFALNDGDDTLQIRQNGGVEVPTEVTHVRSRYFEGGDITWNIKYTTPTEDLYEDALQFWIGANVANGNGHADEKDLNSNFQITVALDERLPSFCATCDDGSAPDEMGNCPSCGCGLIASPPDSVAWVALVGLLGLHRARRKRAKSRADA